MGDWDDEKWGHVDHEALSNLNEAVSMEKSVSPEMGAVEMAQRLLDDAAPFAAQSIINIATRDPNSRVRLSAAQYIVDRALGKPGQDPAKQAPWEELIKGIMS